MDNNSEIVDGEVLPMVLPREEHEAREERGRQIARSKQIKGVGAHFVVPSQTDGGTSYLVDLVEENCTCPDYAERRCKCKHQHAVEFTILWQQTTDASGVVTDTVVVRRKTYPQKNWSGYNAAEVNEKARIEALIRDLCAGIASPTRAPGKGGRPPKSLRDKAIAALTKVYTTKSARKAAGHVDVEDDMHYNSVLNFIAAPSSTPLLAQLVGQSAAPLARFEIAGQYAVDSTGFGTVGYERWFDVKHGSLQSRHQWVKLHAFAGTQTHVVVAVRISKEADCPVLPDLLTDARELCTPLEVSADKAYLSVENVEAIEAAGATPYIAPKVNSILHGRNDAWDRNVARFFLAAEATAPKYHRRSNVETAIGMIKSAFGGSVRSKLETAQMNEVLLKVILHNLRCLVHAVYERGLQEAFWPTQSRELVVRPDMLVTP